MVRLDARLCRDRNVPVAVALSGGGDSVALLALTVEWARAAGRRVLALTVDHALNPDSGGWSRRCEAQARALGAEWRGLTWSAAKPATGIPAAARAARHAFLADAARDVGAAVILMGHTADDVAESDMIRAEGTPIGRLRDWSPSPAWPEGRGLMLLRPLLAERRAALRDLLRARDLEWIEDPANRDERFARARVRATNPLPADTPDVQERDGPVRGTLVSEADGVIGATRDVDARALSAALTCAGGARRTARGDRLAGLMQRLSLDEDFDAVLCGARLTARDGAVLIHREPGEQSRVGLAPLSLEPDRPTVWDGRFEITADEAGLTVVPARGQMSRLSRQDRAALNALPASARGAEPVLLRDGDPRPVLARRAVRVSSLVEARLAAALGTVSHETDLIRLRMAPRLPTAYFEPDEGVASATA